MCKFVLPCGHLEVEVGSVRVEDLEPVVPGVGDPLHANLALNNNHAIVLQATIENT